VAKKSVEEVTLVDNSLSAVLAQAEGKVKITLLKNHFHAGKDYKAGEVIEVEEHHLEFLKEAGVIGKKEE